MIEASATRRPSTPRTRSSASTTAPVSTPMRQVPTGCDRCPPSRWMIAAISSSLRAASPGSVSRAIRRASGLGENLACDAIARTIVAISSGSAYMLLKMRGASSGRAVAEPHPPPRFRMQRADPRRKAGRRRFCEATRPEPGGIADRHADELRIRPLQPRLRFQKYIGRGAVGREQTIAAQCPARREPRGAVDAQMPRQAVVAVHCVHVEHVWMFGKIFADASKIELWIDADRAQVIGRSDAGQHEKLRRAIGAGAQHDLALRVDLRDAAVTLELTPTARPLSMITRVASAPVKMVRFARRDALLR